MPLLQDPATDQDIMDYYKTQTQDIELVLDAWYGGLPNFASYAIDACKSFLTDKHPSFVDHGEWNVSSLIVAAWISKKDAKLHAIPDKADAKLPDQTDEEYLLCYLDDSGMDPNWTNNCIKTIVKRDLPKFCKNLRMTKSTYQLCNMIRVWQERRHSDRLWANVMGQRQQQHDLKRKRILDHDQSPVQSVDHVLEQGPAAAAASAASNKRLKTVTGQEECSLVVRKD